MKEHAAVYRAIPSVRGSNRKYPPPPSAWDDQGVTVPPLKEPLWAGTLALSSRSIGEMLEGWRVQRSERPGSPQETAHELALEDMRGWRCGPSGRSRFLSQPPLRAATSFRARGDAKDTPVPPSHWVSAQMNALVEGPAKRSQVSSRTAGGWRTGTGVWPTLYYMPSFVLLGLYTINVYYLEEIITISFSETFPSSPWGSHFCKYRACRMLINAI